MKRRDEVLVGLTAMLAIVAAVLGSLWLARGGFQQGSPLFAKFPWGASGRALTYDRTDGLTKLIVDPQTHRILGVGIVGHGAGELIGEGAVAVELGATAEDLAAIVHPHPTLSETIMESAEAFFGHATHIFTKKKAAH